jgi:hypothetical protein
MKGKVMLEVFSYWQGIMHHKFIPQGAVVNKQVLSHLWEAIPLMCSRMWVGKA